MEIRKTVKQKPDANPSDAPPAKRKRGNPFNENRKEEREKRRQKRARIIVRNISYKTTDETLRKHFEQYGKIVDLNLLKRPDGKLVGCAFVQFEEVNQAAKAILKGTNTELLGRPVFVDWALGKDEFVKKKSGGEHKPKVNGKEKDEAEVKSESEDGNESENEGDEDADEDDEGKEDDEEDDNDSEEEDSDEEKSIKSEDDSDEEDDDDGSDDEDDKKDVKRKIKSEKNGEKPKTKSNDVQEGCTVFIKNVPFDATDNDLRKVCRKFGPVYYAIINTDRISGHSKGTAFVKFKTKESADLCLQSGEEFVLMDTVLEPHPAMSRDEVKSQSDGKSKDESKDSRNLYLAKEGLIMTGSKAAEGVSASDMNRRHKLEQIKTQVLKNLNRFVSRNRLSIHNLPAHYDNEKLRQMVIKYTNFKPHECRVMRENKITAEHPEGKSKGFGFMSFNTHLDALTALRKLNNNPNVFGPARRPIVAFSIEDRAVHKIKENRLERSRANNPTYREKLEKKKEQKQKQKPKKAQEPDNKAIVQKQIKKLEASRNKQKSKPNAASIPEDEFIGEAAKPGTFVKGRSMKKLRAQAQEHRKNVNEVKRKEKKRKEKQALRAEKKQIDRTRKGEKKQEPDNFSHLVEKYKRMIDDGSTAVKKTKRKKWYTE